MTKRRNYEELPDMELPEDLDRMVRAKTEVADKHIEETRVNFRWGREQLNLVKRVADLMGIPYQTYMKHVLYKQALLDLEASAFSSAAGVAEAGASDLDIPLERASDHFANSPYPRFTRHYWAHSSVAGLSSEPEGMTVRELLDYIDKAASERSKRSGR